MPQGTAAIVNPGLGSDCRVCRISYATNTTLAEYGHTVTVAGVNRNLVKLGASGNNKAMVGNIAGYLAEIVG